jgi:hypothetical protein
MRDNHSEDIWVSMLANRMEASTAKFIIVPDIRYPSEYWGLELDESWNKLVWIKRDGVGVVNDHPSESYYDFLRLRAKYVAHNYGGLEFLEDSAANYADFLVGRFK